MYVHARWLLAILLVAIGTLTVAAGDGASPITATNAADVAPQMALGLGHPFDAAWSPDDSTLAVASDIGIWLIDGETLAVERLILGHSGRVRSVAWSPDGAQLVSGGGKCQYFCDGTDYTVRLWDAETGAAQGEVTGHNGEVVAVAWSPDGARVASAGLGGSVRVWDAATGLLQAVIAPGAVPTAVAWSPDGGLLAMSFDDGSVQVYDPATDEVSTELAAHVGGALDLSWAPDGNTLATAGADNLVRTWALDGTLETEIAPESACVRGVSYDPTGALLAVSACSVVQLWEANPGEIVTQLRGPVDEVYAQDWTSDSARVVALSGTPANADYGVWVWATDGTLDGVLGGYQGAARAVAWSPDGTRVVMAAGVDASDALVWDTTTGVQVARLHQAGSAAVNAVAWSPDGTIVALGLNDGQIRLAAVPSGEALHTFRAHADMVQSVAFSPDGSLLATAGFDRRAVVWNLATGERILELEHGTAGCDRCGVFSVAFDPSGERLATAGADGTTRIWDVSDGEELTEIVGDGTPLFYSVVWSPDGDRIATACAAGVVCVWDADDGSVVRRLEGHEDWVLGVAWSPGGDVIASGSADETVRLWSVATGETLATLDGHSHPVTSAAWSPDGTHLATSSEDGTVRIWAVAE